MNKIFLFIISSALILGQSVLGLTFVVKNQSGAPVTLQIFDSKNKSIYKKDMQKAHVSGPIDIPLSDFGKAKYVIGNKNYTFDMAKVAIRDAARKHDFIVQKDGNVEFKASADNVAPAPGGATPKTALLSYDDLKNGSAKSIESPLLQDIVSPLIKNKVGLARVNFSKLDKKTQEEIQSMSFREIALMSSDYSDYYPKPGEKSVLVSYLLYDGTNTWKNTVGYLLLSVDFKKNTAYVKEFLIKKAYRAAKIGKKLFAMALNDYYQNINPKGKVTLTITGDQKNLEMLSAFYSKFGFKLDEPLPVLKDDDDGIVNMTLTPADYKVPQ